MAVSVKSSPVIDKAVEIGEQRVGPPEPAQRALPQPRRNGFLQECGEVVARSHLVGILQAEFRKYFDLGRAVGFGRWLRIGQRAFLEFQRLGLCLNGRTPP